MVNNIPVTHKPEELRLMQDNTVKSFLDPVLVSLMKKEVNKSKVADEPVNRAFEVIAEKSGLKFNTVRNYYYRYIHEKDNNRAGYRLIRNGMIDVFSSSVCRPILGFYGPEGHIQAQSPCSGYAQEIKSSPGWTIPLRGYARGQGYGLIGTGHIPEGVDRGHKPGMAMGIGMTTDSVAFLGYAFNYIRIKLGLPSHDEEGGLDLAFL